MRVMTVVGTRPEFIQMAPLSESFRRCGHTEILVHTGQHYDFNMSNVFFEDLHLPEPDHFLEVGSGSHAQQTGAMLPLLEQSMQANTPDWVVVFGDTNSTVAAALAAAKLHVPVAHVEAGLRSFDRRMPEEVNRVVTDHLSDLLLAPTTTAVENLKNEGLTRGVHHVGDVRVDLLNGLVPQARERFTRLADGLGLSLGKPFALATIHRASNTDEEANLSGIVQSFNTLDLPVVLPVHPRLRKMLDHYDLSLNGTVRTTDPLGYLDLIALLDACALVLTDSGGLQKEAYMLHRPLVTIRDTTEWVETVEAGWNRLCDPEPGAVRRAVAHAMQPPPAEHPNYYGDLGVCDRIVEVMEHASRTGQSARI
jgi:UDP-GlcNAc3NAcA epimerase